MTSKEIGAAHPVYIKGQDTDVPISASAELPTHADGLTTVGLSKSLPTVEYCTKQGAALAVGTAAVQRYRDGNWNGAIDWTAVGAPDRYMRWTVPATDPVSGSALSYFDIGRVFPFLADGAPIAAAKLGKDVDPATGFEIAVHAVGGAQLTSITGPVPVLWNMHFARSMFDIAFFNAGAGSDGLCGRHTPHRAGAPMRLTPGQYIEVALVNDLSALDELAFIIHGYAWI